MVTLRNFNMQAMDTKYKLPRGFSAPTQQPGEETSQLLWQEHNRAWWEANPMRYDWNERIEWPPFSREYFQEIDRRHFDDASSYCPPRQRPFDALIPFDDLKGCDVLEIGVGQGSHAQLMAPHCRSYTGVDLTENAVRSTQRRFELFGLPG